MSSTLSYVYQPSPFPGMVSMLQRSDGLFVPCALDNREYQEFLAGIAAGNPAPEGWTGPTNQTGATP